MNASNNRIRAILDAVTSASDETALAPDHSEEALALEFVRRHGNEIRYVPLWGRWLHWDARCWQVDHRRKVFSLARTVCRDAATTQMDASRHASARAIASAKVRAAVISLVSDDPRITATVDQWDADPWLLNTPGGTINLRSGERHPSRPNDYMTRMTSVAPGGDCQLWRQFLKAVTRDDEALQSYLQRVAGYALTGLTREQAVFFLHGLGANGKTVFINAISGIMGNYHRVTPIETFTASMSDRHPTELAGLMGARLVTATETEEGRQWAESRLKQLTGGDPISARFMRQDFFEFVPQFKLMIAGNHRPGLRSVDEAIRRRMNLIPFALTIKKEERDVKLGEKLKAEWPGILQWMIDGCLGWQKEGLAPPHSVTAATEEYLTSEDAFQTWLSECCAQGQQYWTSVGDLFAYWRGWAEANGEFPGTAKRFSQRLQAHGFESGKQSGKRGFWGLATDKKPEPVPKEKAYEPPF
ncbi:hypothetical protein JQ599_24745 [Bradyrhizobium diazoefficiens]|nr:phage/plasmid primase, P4 family [Bradyrhizobium diazoefficiens]MBR0703133.1 hypothetical protein [Bradyrhizobium diazoefficiens]MBR0771889.1 hypothetical protein [Bradyrhizobium diazoefficiens]